MTEGSVSLRLSGKQEHRRIRWHQRVKRSVQSGRALRIVGRKVRRRRLSGGRLLIGPFAVISAFGSMKNEIELKLLRREKGMKLVNDKGETVTRITTREHFYVVLRSSFRGKSLILSARRRRAHRENASVAGRMERDGDSLRYHLARKRIFVRPRSWLLRTRKTK